MFVCYGDLNTRRIEDMVLYFQRVLKGRDDKKRKEKERTEKERTDSERK